MRRKSSRPRANPNDPWTRQAAASAADMNTAAGIPQKTAGLVHGTPAAELRNTKIPPKAREATAAGATHAPAACASDALMGVG